MRALCDESGLVHVVVVGVDRRDVDVVVAEVVFSFVVVLLHVEAPFCGDPIVRVGWSRTN